jgi:hypothetical protein
MSGYIGLSETSIAKINKDNSPAEIPFTSLLKDDSYRKRVPRDKSIKQYLGKSYTVELLSNPKTKARLSNFIGTNSRKMLQVINNEIKMDDEHRLNYSKTTLKKLDTTIKENNKKQQKLKNYEFKSIQYKILHFGNIRSICHLFNEDFRYIVTFTITPKLTAFQITDYDYLKVAIIK